MAELSRTCLYELHRRRGGRLVDFAGYELPVRYEPGPVAEHNQARTAAALFDVSHMGVIELRGAPIERLAAALETVVPADIAGLAPGRVRYTFFTNDAGGVLDDVMVTNRGDHLSLVANAGTKHADLALLEAALGGQVEVVERFTELGLLALQGPAVHAVIERVCPPLAALRFMDAAPAVIDGVAVTASRSGYTGEDGFELAMAAPDAERLAERLLAEPEVALAGLAARDSLRLEAGLCLYGHDLEPATTPIEAGLAWAIQKRRRSEGGYPGHEVIAAQLRDGPPRRRVGIVPDGRKPIREGAALSEPADGQPGRPLGVVTSGGFGPTYGGPVAMGYVAAGHSAAGTPLVADVRGTSVPARVVDLPFVAHRYHR